MNIRLARLVVGALIVFAAALGLASSARAQSDATSGTIEGVVSDTTGGVLPGATVRLSNAATGFVRDVVTDEEGRYRGLALPLGTYTITVEMSGFAKGLREDVVLALGRVLRIDFALGVTSGERINVQGGAPVIETTRSEQTSLIDEQSVAKLPINGRNFIDFVKLAPTVGIVQGPDGAEISVNGQRGIYNNVMIDGADANNPFFGEQRGGQRPKYIISLEAVKEFQVVTDGASAEFGRAVGGFVNMVTKSGTNRNQGTAFYFGRYGAPAQRELRRHQGRELQPAPVRRIVRRADQARQGVLLLLVRPERRAARQVEGRLRRSGDQPERRRPAPAEHPAEPVRPDQRGRRRRLHAADQRRARVPRQGRRGAVAGASRRDPLRLLDVRADQRHLRRADVDRHRERHRAGQQPFDRRAGQQRVRADAAERGQGAVRARAAAAAVRRAGSAGHGDRQLPGRRRSLVPLRAAVLPPAGQRDGSALPGRGHADDGARGARPQGRRRGELDVDEPDLRRLRARPLHLHRRHGPVRGVPRRPDLGRGDLRVRALPAARAARRTLDRGVGPAGHPGVGAGVLRPGQVERAAEPHRQRRPALGRPQGAADADAAVRDAVRAVPERPALPDRHRRDPERLPGLAAAPGHHVGSGQRRQDGGAGHGRHLQGAHARPGLGQPAHRERRHLRAVHRRHRRPGPELRRARLPGAGRHRRTSPTPTRASRSSTRTSATRAAGAGASASSASCPPTSRPARRSTTPTPST